MKTETRALPLALALLLTAGCRSARPPEPGQRWRTVNMEVTAYCPCGRCCGWVRNWRGQPVYAYGPRKGKPKAVGLCADGTRARRGTLAADTRHYPFGTRMYIPGYGHGVVHDRGGAIQGPRRLDLFFPTHREALQWGRQTIPVQVAY